MRPDLRNILIVSERRGESARKFLARHRAFSELSAEQSSPTEALVDLLALLKRSSGWSQDAWHNLELDRAVFDVETLLKLLVSQSQLMISGHDCAVTKIDDLIYFVDYAFENRALEVQADGVENQGRRDKQGSIEPKPGDVIAIYSVGRRCGDRREPAPVKRLPLGQPERRLSPRRCGERRRFNRLAPVDCVAGEWTESDRASTPPWFGS
jgi:hypothetical protein